MKKASIAIMLVVPMMASLFLGCTSTGTAGVTTKKADFTDFTSVDVDGAFEVEIIQSDSFSTTFTADTNFLDYIAVTKEGETLKIYFNPRHVFTVFPLGGKAIKVKITMPRLAGLSLSGATKGTVSGFKSAENFNLKISGASSLNMSNFQAANVDAKISGASKVSGSMSANETEFEVSGASKIQLQGQANKIVLDVSGASQADLISFPVSNASVELSGASEANLHVKERLDCSLSDASKLYFLGNPVVDNIKVSGASTIKHK